MHSRVPEEAALELVLLPIIRVAVALVILSVPVPAGPHPFQTRV